MAEPLLTAERLEAELRRVLGEDGVRERPAAPVAFRTPGPCEISRELRVNGGRWQARWCPSVLAVREQLCAPATEEGLVLLTPVDERQLGQDALARLHGRRVHRPDLWRAVAGLFRAHGQSPVDPRLRAHRELAEALVAHAPADGYPPVSGGTLDLDTAWRALLRQALEYAEREPSGVGLLHWSSVPGKLSRHRELSPALREEVRAYLADKAGPTAGFALRVVEAGTAEGPLVLALVVHVLEAAPAETAAAPARLLAGRCYDAFGGVEPEGEERAAVSRDACGLLSAPDLLSSESRRDALTALDELVTAKGVPELLRWSDVSPRGWHQRLDDLAAALGAEPFDREGAWAGLARLERHDLAEEHRALLPRAAMLVRLACWLAGEPEDLGRGLDALADAYVERLAWTDRAREHLLAADVGPELRSASEALLARAGARRETFNRAFGERLAAALADGVLPGDLIGVEGVLDRVVSRLAETRPVLLAVVDGMSWSVAHELSDSLARRGWHFAETRAGGGLRPVVAALPSVTDLCRCSLLSGQLSSGQAAAERAAFPGHAGLASHCRADKPPALFHKADLQGRWPDVEAALRDRQRRVVGVVLNAVDDQLAGAESLHLEWTVDGIKPLASLLEAAEAAGRLVVVASDHGHVREAGSGYVHGDGSERWRLPGDGPGEGEVRIAGSRRSLLMPAF